MQIENRLPDDPALQHLEEALDPQHMAETLLTHGFKPAGQFEVEDCAIERVKYKPGRNCLISYRVRASDRTTGAVIARRFCGRVYVSGGSTSRFHKAEAQPLAALPNGPPLFHLPELDMVVWAFPNDRKLRNLPLLVDDVTLPTSQLTPALQSVLGSGRFQLTNHRLVHYAPEHTCCVRVEGRWQSPDDAVGKPMILYGKTYDDDRGAETFSVMSQLFDLRNHGRPAPITPRALHYDHKRCILWQEGLPGKNLADCAPTPALFAGTAATLAALHRTKIVCRHWTSAPDMAANLDRLAVVVDAACPDVSGFVNALVGRLRGRAPTRADDPVATLHGDCHAQNFLVDGDRIALIDLDNAMLGPPLHDIGSLVATLLYRGCVDHAPPARVLPSIEAFLAGYRAAVPWTIDDDDVAWYTATALLQERVYRAVTRLKAGRLALIEDLIKLAGRLTEDGLGVLTHARRAVA